jgi:CRP-like cAMP-binding protein
MDQPLPNSCRFDIAEHADILRHASTVGTAPAAESAQDTVQEPWPFKLPAHQRTRAVRARHVIYRAGDPLEGVPVIVDGWAACISRLSNGRRQILNFLLPGDMVCANAVFTGRLSFFVEAITAVRCFAYDRHDFLGAMASEPGAFNALIRTFLSEKSQADELVTDLGCRSAPERIARLILHLLRRLELRGQVIDGACAVPLRQQHMADTTGLTSVYVNRVLRSFRADGLLELSGGRLRVLDLAALRRVADGRP